MGLRRVTTLVFHYGVVARMLEADDTQRQEGEDACNRGGEDDVENLPLTREAARPVRAVADSLQFPCSIHKASRKAEIYSDDEDE